MRALTKESETIGLTVLLKTSLFVDNMAIPIHLIALQMEAWVEF
jgi:hypothetical protein